MPRPRDGRDGGGEGVQDQLQRSGCRGGAADVDAGGDRASGAVPPQHRGLPR